MAYRFLPLLALAAALSASPVVAAGDLTGIWSNTSLTLLTRPLGTPLVVSEADARGRAQRIANALAADLRPTDPKAGAPPPGSIGQPVDSFWSAAGDIYARINSQYRASWIVEPADGQLPLTTAGKARAAAAALTRSRLDPTGPEHLAPNDRCLIASRGSGGPGMLNNIYNNYYQIVLTPEAAVIVIEMVHDARIVPIFSSKAAAQASHGPPVLQRWLGDSTGWWEGQTLVVETTNVNAQQGAFGPIYLSAKGRVTERFTRESADRIAYEFTVEDAIYYTRLWRAEMSLNATKDPIYEFACHEGNYAMSGILGGARAVERAAIGQ